jgi:hypothetical protein
MFARPGRELREMALRRAGLRSSGRIHRPAGCPARSPGRPPAQRKPPAGRVVRLVVPTNLLPQLAQPRHLSPAPLHTGCRCSPQPDMDGRIVRRLRPVLVKPGWSRLDWSQKRPAPAQPPLRGIRERGSRNCRKIEVVSSPAYGSRDRVAFFT